MEDKIKRIFTEKLNYYLRIHEKTQADLVKAMGVSAATASDWCNGKKMPRADRLQAIAQWLGIELSDLLPEKDDPVQTFEQALMYNHGVMMRHFGELSDEDKQFVNTLIEKLWKGGDT